MKSEYFFIEYVQLVPTKSVRRCGTLSAG